MGYTKMTKSDKFGDLNIYILRSSRLSFLYSQKYKVFGIDILQVYGINHWQHPKKIEFFESKYGFQILKQAGSLVLRSQKSLLLIMPLM
jgi:hypothetical protein